MNESPIQNPFDDDEHKQEQPSYYQEGMAPVEEEASPRSFIFLMAGIAAAGCGLLLAGMLYFYQPQVQSVYDQYFPSPTATATYTPVPTATITPTPTKHPTPTQTPTPHVLLTPSQGETVFIETFANNDRDWYSYYRDARVQVLDGKLVFRATTADIIGVVFCTTCPVFHDAYYFQAELYTTKETSEEYGLAFCSSGYSSDYYVFYIDPQDKNFGVYRHISDTWEEIIYEHSSVIRNHPASNTLGVLYQHGESMLYINNTLVFTYQDDKPLNCRKTGFIVNDGLVDVSVDNVFGYVIQMPTPTP